METRSYKFGELKRKIQESASEFMPVIGKGVIGKEKEINRKANRETEKRIKDYEGGIKGADANRKVELEQPRNGLSDIQYDGELSKKFKDRAKANLAGYSSEIEMRNHSKEEHGNASFDDTVAKELERLASVRKSDGDSRSEIGIRSPQRKKGETHLHHTNIAEQKKIRLLKFKKVQFISESQMLAHVPDEYKENGNKFVMQDCTGDKYLVEWSDRPEVTKALNEDRHSAEVDRIKYLFGYSAKDERTTNSIRMNEDSNVEDMIGKARKLMR